MSLFSSGCGGHHWGEQRLTGQMKIEFEYTGTHAVRSSGSSRNRCLWYPDSELDDNSQNIGGRNIVLFRKSAKHCQHDGCSAKKEQWVRVGRMDIETFLGVMKNE